MIFKKFTALFIVVLFLSIISVPTIISSIDNTIDISLCDGMGEEEEIENFKILLEPVFSNIESTPNVINKWDNIDLIDGFYSRPLLHIISPPPELQS